MINSVRNTVLSTLNKNNYGYISPADFNLYAKQAQLEVFEEYFSNYNKTVTMENLRRSGTDYADLGQALAETMEYFLTSNFLIKSTTNNFFIPSVTTTGDEAYMVSRLSTYTTLITTSTNTTVLSGSLVDSAANFIAAGVQVGDIVSNASTNQVATVTTVTSATSLVLSKNIFPSTGIPPTGVGYFIYSASNVKDLEKVSSGKITMLNNSMLTAPSLLFPAYTQENDVYRAYPAAISNPGQVQAVYFRYPLDPKWTYISLAGGEPAFDQSQPDYQDFEMPAEDEFKLITKILQYCGVSIREAQVTQFATAKEQREQPTFSQQQ
jgi:hypothetical protein